MIGIAIRSLAEEGGSTEQSISQFIRSNYENIPWGHDRLLPYYLKKLVAEAEIIVVAPGRYFVIPPQFQEAAGGEERPQHFQESTAEGEGKEMLDHEEHPLQFQEEEEEVKEMSDIEEGFPIECEGDLVMVVQALPLPTSSTGPKPVDEVCDPQEKPKRRGRTLKKKPPREAMGLDNLKPKKRHWKEKPIGEIGQPQEKSKRRGRPPKTMRSTEAMSPMDGVHDSLSLNSSEQMAMEVENVEPEKCSQEKPIEEVGQVKAKKRGRPPKKMRPTEAVVPMDGLLMISSEPMGLQANSVEPSTCPQEKPVEEVQGKHKRRGRPPNKQQQHKEVMGPTESCGGGGLSSFSSEPMGLKGDRIEPMKCPQEKLVEGREPQQNLKREYCHT